MIQAALPQLTKVQTLFSYFLPGTLLFDNQSAIHCRSSMAIYSGSYTLVVVLCLSKAGNLGISYSNCVYVVSAQLSSGVL